jgi:pre-mRNA-splicing factor CWC26
MSSSLAEYLAKNYLTADSQLERPKKKRKKNKHAEEPDGLIIADDDPPPLQASTNDRGSADEDAPCVIDTSQSTAEFRRRKKSNWKTVGGPVPASSTEDGSAKHHASEQAAADAIIASAAAENAARLDTNVAEDAPAIVDMPEDDGLPQMESGAKAGLQTAEQTAAMVAARQQRQKAEAATGPSSKDVAAAAAAQETIYRDASGRIINVAMKRAEARRAAEEQRLKEEEMREALMGDVQRQEREARRQELHEARLIPLARTADDEALNEELKARQRWNDPAAQFLSAKKSEVSTTGRPIYRGAYAPNRYGIRPGYRWDGVDRSTGFEKEWFAARNRKERLGALEYAWQMDE